MLLSERSIWTMVHGIGLGGAALLGLAAALFYVYAARPSSAPIDSGRESRAFAAVTIFTAVMLWFTVIVGTYVVFPSYRVTPPAGTTDLSQFPLCGHSGTGRMTSREFWDSELGFGTVLGQFSLGKRSTRTGELPKLQ